MKYRNHSQCRCKCGARGKEIAVRESGALGIVLTGTQPSLGLQPADVENTFCKDSRIIAPFLKVLRFLPPSIISHCVDMLFVCLFVFP